MKELIALASCDPMPFVVDDEVALVEALLARGVEVVRPAWDADFDWSGCAAVLIRTTWDYHTRAAEFVAWCERAAAVTRLFHGPAIVRWNIDKRYLAALEEGGVRLAPTLWLMPGDPLPERLPAAFAGRAFMKPVVGANAFATLRLEAGADDAERRAAIEAFRREHPTLGFMLQPYLASVEVHGELSAIVIGGRVAHAIRKVPAAGDYRVQEDWGARDEAYAMPDEEVALAERAVARASALVGEPLLYARVDFLRDADGQLVLNELEAIEPALFLRHGPATAGRLADALLAAAGLSTSGAGGG
ncbi:MAG: hypothetical protein U1F43_24350 [Myxococcota bacterium]